MSDFFNGANSYLNENIADDRSMWGNERTLNPKQIAPSVARKTLRIVPSSSSNAWLKDRENIDVKAELKSLVRRMDERLGPASRLTERLFCAEYAAVIGLGPKVVPLLIKDLQRSLQPWFWALKAITREDPARHINPGDFHGIAAAWIAWGKDNDIV